MNYDQKDLELLRQCGIDNGGPVSWTLDDYISMAHCDYVLRFRRGGDARVRMRLLIRRARDAFRRERGSEENCPWDDDYNRRVVSTAFAEQPVNAKDITLKFLEENTRAKRGDIVQAMADRGYSQDTIDEALGVLVTEGKISRESWGYYSFGSKKSKKQEESDVA